MKKLWILLRAVIFLIILGLTIFGIQRFFGPDHIRSFEHERGFAEQRNGSLDAVYIGGSDVHAFWQPMFGWADHGIAVWSFSIDALSIRAVMPMLREARRSQPNALYIISLSAFKKDSAKPSMVDIHRAVDYQPFSFNKIRSIEYLTEGTEFQGLDKLEFYFPIIRFHSRWDELRPWVFNAPSTDYKGSMHANYFLSNIEDQTGRIVTDDATTPLPDDVKAELLAVLDYCDEEKVNTLFVKSPQADTKEELGRMNSAEALIKERGYPCVDMLDEFEKTGIQTDTDFYNDRHTNVHGSLKFSKYLGDYLVEHYGFEDKRGQPEWESWDKSWESYLSYIAPQCLPIEREHVPRDYSLSAPKVNSPEVNKRTIHVTWNASKGATGYAVFRKTPAENEYAWKLLTVVDADTLSYDDKNLKKKTAYTYTVVPYREGPEGRLYGCFSYSGKKATTGGK